MRISSVLAFAAVATLSASAFAAPSGSIASASQASTVQVNASEHSMYKLTPDEARAMRGTFQLDDGRLLVLTSQRSKVFADFDGKREELVQVGMNRFVSRDTGAQLSFNRVPFSDEVVLDQIKR